MQVGNSSFTIVALNNRFGDGIGFAGLRGLEQEEGMRPPAVEIRRHRPATPWTYELLDQRQREVAARVREGGAGALLLNEVAPVITMGRRTPMDDIQVAPELLASMGVGLHRTDRGGMATWHGPGQWVLFAVDRLESLTGDPRGVRKAVSGLLNVAYQLALGLGYQPDENGLRIGEDCETGVWIHQGKFAAVGVHIEQGVLLHGLAVNIHQTATSFQGLRPCGLDKPVGYLLGRDAGSTSFDEVGLNLHNLALSNLWQAGG